MAWLGQKRTSELGEGALDALAAGVDLPDVPVEVVAVFEGDGKSVEGDAVDVVGRADLAEVAEEPGVAGEHADAEVGEAVGFREGAADDEVGDMADVGQGGFAVEVEVGLVDEDDGVRGGGADLEELSAADDGAGGVVGRGDHDELGARA